MRTMDAPSEPAVELVCIHLDSVERRLLQRPSRDEIEEIQRSLEQVVTLVRSIPVPVGAPRQVESNFRPIQRKLGRLSALLEQALVFCEGWQSLLQQESGYNTAGAWNEAPPVRGLLDHRG